MLAVLPSDVVLIPWWRATTRILPGLKVCYKNLLHNRAWFDALSAAALSNDARADSVAPSPESMSSTVNSPPRTASGQCATSQRSSVSAGGPHPSLASGYSDQKGQGDDDEPPSAHCMDNHGQDEDEQGQEEEEHTE